MQNNASVAPLRKERVKVLIVTHGNGLIEAYAGNHVDVHFVNRLYVGNETADAANLIDQYHEGTMPRCYQDLYFSNKCRVIGFHEKVTPEQAANALYQRSILRGLREEREAQR